MTDLRRLPEIAAALQLDLADDVIAKLAQYRDLLLDANRQFNLTAIDDHDEFDQRLIGESLALLPLIPPESSSLLDIGSGGGIPGIVIAIVRPDLSVSLLDATNKKVRFLAETIDTLALVNVTAIHGRAEELARQREHRDRYDVVTARAVARLVALVELTLPFVSKGGLAVLPKSDSLADELAEARYAIGMLGGRARPPERLAVDGTTAVLIDKRKATPAQFPRNTGVPNKTPLLAL